MLKLLHDNYGTFYMHEENLELSSEKEAELKRRFFKEKELPPEFYKVEKVSYEDGLKIYYENGGWIVARFSGTEKLLRVFVEMPTKREARKLADEFLAYFNILE